MNSKQQNGKKLEIVLLTIAHNTKKLLLVRERAEYKCSDYKNWNEQDLSNETIAMNADVRENEGSLKSIEQMANIGIIYGLSQN